MWQAHEHEFHERSHDWYWAVGIVAVSSALAAAILGNILFGLLIIMAAFILALRASKQPDMVSVELSERGIRIDKTLYPYRTLDSFYVTHPEPGTRMEPKLLVQSKKPLVPLLIVPFASDIHPDMIHDYLIKYIPEEEHREPLSHHLLEMVGL